MRKQSEFKGISQRARRLLSRGEDRHVDYKRDVNGLHAEDLVAFANSSDGGAILIGVVEAKDGRGRQRGNPVGCPIGDNVKLQIMGKALSCSPPVQLEIFTENLNSNPFYRIEIPSGLQKPYATNNGTYKIREDARNAPLLPADLLRMFLEREVEEFRRRFSEATGDLETQVLEITNTVSEMEYTISSKIEDMTSSLGLTEYQVGEATSTIDHVAYTVEVVKREAQKQQKRIKGLLSHLDAPDPVKAEAEKEFFDDLVKQLTDDEELLEAVKRGQSISISGDVVTELDQEDLGRVLRKAVQEVEKGKNGES